jgi:hypothetical protein
VERFSNASVGRGPRMVELRKEVNELLARAGSRRSIRSISRRKENEDDYVIYQGERRAWRTLQINANLNGIAPVVKY